VPRSLFLVPRSLFLVPRSLFLVPRSPFLVHRSPCLVPSNLVSHSRTDSLKSTNSLSSLPTPLTSSHHSAFLRPPLARFQGLSDPLASTSSPSSSPPWVNKDLLPSVKDLPPLVKDLPPLVKDLPPLVKDLPPLVKDPDRRVSKGPDPWVSKDLRQPSSPPKPSTPLGPTVNRQASTSPSPS
jgi:hypothetical protein